MPMKSYKPEEIVAKLRLVDVLTSQGQSAADAIRSIGVSEVTYYRWRQEFGGLMPTVRCSSTGSAPNNLLTPRRLSGISTNSVAAASPWSTHLLRTPVHRYRQDS
jgi:hypothetical protein